MNLKSFLAMSMLVTAGCSSYQPKEYRSYDEYPVYEGKWADDMRNSEAVFKC